MQFNLLIRSINTNPVIYLIHELSAVIVCPAGQILIIIQYRTSCKWFLNDFYDYCLTQTNDTERCFLLWYKKKTKIENCSIAFRLFFSAVLPRIAWYGWIWGGSIHYKYIFNFPYKYTSVWQFCKKRPTESGILSPIAVFFT